MTKAKWTPLLVAGAFSLVAVLCGLILFGLYEPRTVENYIREGDRLFAKGQSVEAVARYQEALKLDPSRAELHAKIGDVYMQAGGMDQGIAHYHKALALDSQEWSVHNRIAAAYAAIHPRQWERAIYHAELASPHNVLYRQTLGALWAKRAEEALADRNWENALTWYEIAGKILSEQDEFLARQAHVHSMRGDWSRCARSLEDYLTRRPGGRAIHALLARAYWKTGEDMAALNQLEILKMYDEEEARNLAREFNMDK